MRLRTPIGVALLGALTATLVAGAAAGELPDGHDDSATAPAQAAALSTPSSPAADIAATLQRADANARRAERAQEARKRRAAQRRRRARAAAKRRPLFPVVGPHRYGDAVARFGNNRGDHMHGGQDVFAAAGTPVRAVENGRVVTTGTDGSRGNYIELRGMRSKRTYDYFHLKAPASVHAGQKVKRGRRMGRVGCTGRCFGDHLHFEVHRKSGQGIDPLPFLRRWEARRA